MLNDIFAMSMSGSFERHRGDELLAHGIWSYRGYGNAEIELQAEGVIEGAGLRYHLRLHSVERQIDVVEITTQQTGLQQGKLRFDIAGHEMKVCRDSGDDSVDAGRLSFPSETVFIGPSPIWLIHLMITSLPPSDRVVTTPVIEVTIPDLETKEGYYRVGRKGTIIAIEQLDDNGEHRGEFEVEIADDGVPTLIKDAEHVLTIVRNPQVFA